MSNPLSIQAGLAYPGVGDSIAPAGLATPAAGQAHATPTQTSQTPAATQTAKPIPLFVNPSFSFDPTVGIVVIDFHDDKGTVTSSIPSQRLLEAYREHLKSPPGEQPVTPPPTPAPEPTLTPNATPPPDHGKTSPR